jgi:RNA polymerase sigma factor (TIGR02999 family)
MIEERTLTPTDPQQGSQAWLSEVYDCLRELATAWFRAERAGHTLQPTALVHEAYLRLLPDGRAHAADRTQFLGLAAITMRRVLIDHGRRRRSQKRGGGQEPEILDTSIPEDDALTASLAIHLAVEKLARKHERAAQVVVYRYFGGMTVRQVAELMGVNPSTIVDDWVFARTWLHRELSADATREIEALQ